MVNSVCGSCMYIVYIMYVDSACDSVCACVCIGMWCMCIVYVDRAYVCIKCI